MHCSAVGLHRIDSSMQLELDSRFKLTLHARRHIQAGPPANPMDFCTVRLAQSGPVPRLAKPADSGVPLICLVGLVGGGWWGATQYPSLHRGGCLLRQAPRFFGRHNNLNQVLTP